MRDRKPCNGKLLQLSPVTELYNELADAFVAAFTESINRIGGRAATVAHPFSSVQTSAGAFDARMTRDIVAGQEVHVMIGPENVRLDVKRDGDTAAAGRIARASFMGSQTNYEVDAFGARTEVVEAGTTPRFRTGVHVIIDLAAAACLAYPAT